MLTPFVRATQCAVRSHQLQLAGRQVIQKRNSGGPWYFRQAPPHDTTWTRRAQYTMCFMWAWVTYHCLTDYGHLVGHFILPDPKDFTNEELGVVRDI